MAERRGVKIEVKADVFVVFLPWSGLGQGIGLRSVLSVGRKYHMVACAVISFMLRIPYRATPEERVLESDYNQPPSINLKLRFVTCHRISRSFRPRSSLLPVSREIGKVT